MERIIDYHEKEFTLNVKGFVKMAGRAGISKARIQSLIRDYCASLPSSKKECHS